MHVIADFKSSVFLLDYTGTELIEQKAEKDVIRSCKEVPGVVDANQNLLCERDNLIQNVTVLILLCEPNPCAVRGRRTPGEDDEQEDPVMQGLRDDVVCGLDDGWSVANSASGHGAGVLDARVSVSLGEGGSGDLGEGGSRTPRWERTPRERGKARIRAEVAIT